MVANAFIVLRLFVGFFIEHSVNTGSNYYGLYSVSVRKCHGFTCYYDYYSHRGS